MNEEIMIRACTNGTWQICVAPNAADVIEERGTEWRA